MKILITGASRGLGRETAWQAMQAGHQITAFSRHPDRSAVKHPALRLFAGDVTDAAAVEQVVKGQDAVIITLGLPTRLAIGPPLARRSRILSLGTGRVIKAMQKHRVKRLLTETAIASGDSQPDCTPLARLAFRGGLRWLFTEKDRQEQLTLRSELDWTIVRPTALTNGPRTNPLVGEHLPAGVLTHVSRADVAATMIDLLDDRWAIGKALTISYPPRFGDSLRWLRAYR